MHKISANIIAYNEADRIYRTVKEARRWVDEVIVIDQESTDKTATLARLAGAEVHRHPHTGYAESSRQFAVDQSSYPWIIQLDADERLTRQTGRRLREIASSGLALGYWLEIQMNLSNEPRFRGDWKYRLFHRENVVFEDRIHTGPEPRDAGLVRRLDSPEGEPHIIHDKTWEEIFWKELRYEEYAFKHRMPEILGMNVHLDLLRKYDGTELKGSTFTEWAQQLDRMPVHHRRRLGFGVTPGMYAEFAADRTSIIDILS